MNTRIGYRYRDASNYKAYNEVIVEGVVTLKQIQPFLHDGEFFIPDAVGLRELQSELTSFPSVDDHVWHEIDVIEATDEESNYIDSAEDLLKKFSDVGEWNVLEASRRLGII